MKILSLGQITAQIVGEAPIQKQELVVVWDILVSKFEKDENYSIKQIASTSLHVIG